MAKSANRRRWTLPVPKGPFHNVHTFLSQPATWIRIGLFLAFATGLYVLMNAWDPPFPYRTRIAPLRNLHARTSFESFDRDATLLARSKAQRNFPMYYVNNSRPLDELRQGLLDELFEVKQKTYSELVSNNLWSRFWSIDLETSLPLPNEDTEKEFDRFKNAFAKDEQLAVTGKSIENAFTDIRRRGLLRNLGHDLGNGSVQKIQVYQSSIDDAIEVSVSEVRMAEVLDELRANLISELSKNHEVIAEPVAAAERLYNWLKPRLPVTLSWDEDNSKMGQKKAASAVEDKMKQYLPGDALESYRGVEESVIGGLEPLDETDIALLAAEHQALVASQTVSQRLSRTGAFFGFLFAVGALVAGYLYYRDDDLLLDIRHFVTLLGLFSATLAIAWIFSYDVNWRAEMVPIVMFAIIVAIAYRIELSIFLSAMVALSLIHI